MTTPVEKFLKFCKILQISDQNLQNVIGIFRFFSIRFFELDKSAGFRDCKTDDNFRAHQPVVAVGDKVMIYYHEGLIRRCQEQVKLSTPNNISLICNKKGTVKKFTKMCDVAVQFQLDSGSKNYK